LFSVPPLLIPGRSDLLAQYQCAGKLRYELLDPWRILFFRECVDFTVQKILFISFLKESLDERKEVQKNYIGEKP
jgi:hypothetical protein